MKIFDKAQWHIDAGETVSSVTNKFSVIFNFLNENEFLSDDGIEVLDLGIDSSISLNDKMVTEKGAIFLEKYYDQIINYSCNEVDYELRKCYRLFADNK